MMFEDIKREELPEREHGSRINLKQNSRQVIYEMQNVREDVVHRSHGRKRTLVVRRMREQECAESRSAIYIEQCVSLKKERETVSEDLIGWHGNSLSKRSREGSNAKTS
uniref:Uncharacterized protein n=1 Tax=Haemonchus contortus TaxID=6289 RepID=A0A7I4Y4I3_HAECO